MYEIRKIGNLSGYLHEIEIDDPSKILVFQVPRKTDQMSEAYRDESIKIIQDCLKTSQPVLVVGCDINIFEVFSTDVSALKLKGLI